MIYLRQPDFSVRESIKRCIENTNKPEFSVNRESIVNDIIDTERSFRELNENHQVYRVPKVNRVGGIWGSEVMTSFYQNKMVRKKTSGRELYDAIMSLPEHGICPLCGHRPVSTLDHYLPKSLYPCLTLTPINLIPVCMDCNKKKGSFHPNDECEAFIHPYFDKIDSEKWLHAKVNELIPVSLTFYSDPPDFWGSISERINWQFSFLDLGRLYSSQAANELSNIGYELRLIYNHAGEDSLRKELGIKAESRRRKGRNSWQTALYEALFESQWFCREGVLQI